MNLQQFNLQNLQTQSQRLFFFCRDNNKQVGLSVILFLFVVMAVNKSTPPHVEPIFALKIYKNRSDIRQLDDERNIAQQKTVHVDTLNLKDGYHLRHPKLGLLGFDHSFFIDVEETFRVKKAGLYYFYPGSDDGFALWVDGKKLCEYLGDRAYSTQRCSLELDEGDTPFRLAYFQGHGHSGLTLAYKHKDMKKRKWFGEDSSYLEF